MERLHARALPADDSRAYRAGVEDALAEMTDVLERPVTADGSSVRRVP